MKERRKEKMNPFSSLHCCLCNIHLRIFTHLSEALQPFDTYGSSHTHTHAFEVPNESAPTSAAGRWEYACQRDKSVINDL